MAHEEIKSTGELEKLSISKLLKIYNEVAPRPVKGFRNHDVAVQRTLAMLAAQQGKSAATSAPPRSSMPRPGAFATAPAPKPFFPPAPERAAKPKKERAAPAQGGGHHGRLRQPINLPAKAELKSHRPGTKRANVILFLSQGKWTFYDIARMIGWDERTAYEGIRLVHQHLGYGIREDEKGVMHLLYPPGYEKPAPAAGFFPPLSAPLAKERAERLDRARSGDELRDQGGEPHLEALAEARQQRIEKEVELKIEADTDPSEPLEEEAT